MHLSWIIPSYNEERRIEKTIREVYAYLQSKNFADGYEIIVANSASKDRTPEIVKILMAEIPQLRILDVTNLGKGWAVKEAMLNARGDIRIFSDADNSTAPNYFDAMEPLFAKGYDVVISSRDSKDAAGASRDVKEQWYREILGNMGNLVIQIFGVWGIWDTQNGFKACTAKAGQDIFSRTRMAGFSFDIEMLGIARMLKYRIGIIPVKWKFDPDSKVTLGSYIQVFVDVFEIRWNFIRGAYKNKFGK
ncbi:MAG: glycosyltransferase [bacterium]|nr:glycosyltransferase [bacterium]MDZ4286276.1 glycosyltransferase [Candidatus Sungbacteria bacterium]